MIFSNFFKSFADFKASLGFVKCETSVRYEWIDHFFHAISLSYFKTLNSFIMILILSTIKPFNYINFPIIIILIKYWIFFFFGIIYIFCEKDADLQFYSERKIKALWETNETPLKMIMKANSLKGKKNILKFLTML